MPALSHCAYHSKQVENTVGYWVCWIWKRGVLCLACKFQSRLRYPSGALADSQNQFGEGAQGSQALFFVSASICRRLSHIHTSLFALHHCLPVFASSSIYLLLFHHTLFLPLSIWLFVFSSHLPSIPCVSLLSSHNESAFLFCLQ